jgi:hypothetical protein
MFKQLTFKGDGAFWPLTERADSPHRSRPGSLLAAPLALPLRLAAAA